MGDDGVKSSEKSFSYTEVFEEMCPYFIAIGMSYEQYWNEDCWIASYYLKAHKIKQEQQNEILWLQGVYIYEALCDVSPVLHAFSKRGTKPRPYCDKPYDLFKKKEKEVFTEEENEKEQQRAYEFFVNWSKATAKKLGQ